MLMKYFSIITRCGHAYAARSLQEYEISSAEHSIVTFLFDNKNVNQDTISKHFNLDKGTVAKTLTRLEQKGLISREVNPENHREKIISLTQTAVTKSSIMCEVLNDWDELLYDGISQEEIDLFTSIIKKMARNATIALNKERLA